MCSKGTVQDWKSLRTLEILSPVASCSHTLTRAQQPLFTDLRIILDLYTLYVTGNFANGMAESFAWGRNENSGCCILSCW